MPFKIGKHSIGHNEPCFIIAEIGINHNGDIDVAKRMIEEAKKANVDAVKFQTINPVESYTQESESYKVFKDRELTLDQYHEIVNFCHELDIIFLTTPGDFSSLKICQELKLPAYKISSGLMTNMPLITKAIESKVPLIISTGASYLWEVGKLVSYLEHNAFNDAVFLHCVTQYPASAKQLNLNAIQTMRNAFPCPVGYSDHYPGNTACIAAVTLGACMIEKHFTIDEKPEVGADDHISLNPEEMKQLVYEIRECEEMFQTHLKSPVDDEIPFRSNYRRFLVATKSLPAGHVLTEEDMIAKRKPDHTGFPPEMLPQLIGLKTVRDITMNDPLGWEAVTTKDQ